MPGITLALALQPRNGGTAGSSRIFLPTAYRALTRARGKWLMAAAMAQGLVSLERLDLSDLCHETAGAERSSWSCCGWSC